MRLKSLLSHRVSMAEACCEHMTIVLRKERRNTSKTLPNQCVSMREAGFCKDYAGTPFMASRFHWGTQVFSYYAVTSAAECTYPTKEL